MVNNSLIKQAQQFRSHRPRLLPQDCQRVAPLKAIHVVSFAKRASPTMQRANQNASGDFGPTWPLPQDYPFEAILDMTRSELPQMWMDQKLGDHRWEHEVRTVQ